MKKYFYIKNKERLGPYTLEELKKEPIYRDTKIWFEGLEEWTKLNKIEELNDFVSPPPIPNIENKTKKYLNFSKWQIRFLGIWLSLLLCLLFLTKTENSDIYNYTISSKSRFWPITSEFYATKTENHPTMEYNCMEAYTGKPCFNGILADFDFTEVIIYSLIPLIFFIYKNEK